MLMVALRMIFVAMLDTQRKTASLSTGRFA
jgi:hypothetical protein